MVGDGIGVLCGFTFQVKYRALKGEGFVAVEDLIIFPHSWIVGFSGDSLCFLVPNKSEQQLVGGGLA